MKYLVLLAGCGLGDGSCIEEVILTYTILDKYHCDYTPVAENSTASSINHITEQPDETRNVLTEAARIGRGKIQDLKCIPFHEYDALIIPGGLGLFVNYRKSEPVKACVEYFLAQKKPIATMCAGIDFLRMILNSELLQEETKELSARDFCYDSNRNIFYTPAFRKTGNCYKIMCGIDAMINAINMGQGMESSDEHIIN